MGDQFNMSMPGEPQIGLPGNHTLDRIKQEAGVEMHWEWAVAAGLSVVSGIMGRNDAKNARKDEEAHLRQRYNEYDLPLWEMQKDKLIAQRDEIIRGIELQQRNEEILAAFKDTNNLRNYQQSLKIHNYQYEQQKKLYDKSEALYGNALLLNEGQARSAKASVLQQQREIEQGYAFQNEDAILEGIIQRGQLASEGRQGRSAAKEQQSQLASQGRQQAILTESLVSAGRNTRMQLKDIDQQHAAANLQAHAQRMLKPEKGPDPLAPLAAVVPEFELPRELEDFDFGPQPLVGVATTQVPSFGSVMVNAASSGLSTYAATTAGGNNFNNNSTSNYGGYYTNESNSFGGTDQVWNYG